MTYKNIELVAQFSLYFVWISCSLLLPCL